MAELSLPASVDFSKRLPSLPENVNSSLITVLPTNGNSFKAGSVVSFDLPARDGLFIDPKSLFLRYRFRYSSGATAPIMRCTPATAPFFKLDEYVGSQPINSVYNYHQVSNMWINTHMSVADKYGVQAALGLGSTTTLPALDSLTLAASQASLAGSVSFAFPIVCSAITSADHYVPTGLMAPLRVQFTLAQISDIVSVSANLTDYQIENIELCLIGVDMGVSVQHIVASMGPKLYLRTTAWANSGQQLASGFSGVASLPFNHRYQSIENLYMLNSGAAVATDVNAWGDSRDVTSGNGSYQFTIGSTAYPLLPIQTDVNRPAVIQYLRECTGSLSDWRNSMSINGVEFAYNGNTGTTTETEPAKFIVGVPLSKIQGSNPYAPSSLLSGVNASSTPIIANIRVGTATAQAFNVYLVAEYTELIEIDPMTKQVVIIQ